MAAQSHRVLEADRIFRMSSLTSYLVPDRADELQSVANPHLDAFVVLLNEQFLGDQLTAYSDAGHAGFEPTAQRFFGAVDAACRHDSRPGTGSENGFDEIRATHRIAWEHLHDFAA